GGAMHGQMNFIGEIYFGFDEERLFVRIDPLREGFAQLRDCEFRVVFEAGAVIKLIVRVHDGKLASFSAEQDGKGLISVDEHFSVAIGKIMEVSLARKAFALAGHRTIRFSASLWRDELALDVVPREGTIEFPLGEDSFAWPIEPPTDAAPAKNSSS
ncbi:MAG: hypothetical protein WBF30_17645, partial [Candidatus Acidiferrales bacterium]